MLEAQRKPHDRQARRGQSIAGGEVLRCTCAACVRADRTATMTLLVIAEVETEAMVLQASRVGVVSESSTVTTQP